MLLPCSHPTHVLHRIFGHCNSVEKSGFFRIFCFRARAPTTPFTSSGFVVLKLLGQAKVWDFLCPFGGFAPFWRFVFLGGSSQRGGLVTPKRGDEGAHTPTVGTTTQPFTDHKHASQHQTSQARLGHNRNNVHLTSDARVRHAREDHTHLPDTTPPLSHCTPDQPTPTLFS